MAKLSKQDAEKFYEQHKGKPYFNEVVGFLSSDLVVAIEVLAENCIAKIKDLIGNPNPQKAKSENKSSIRAQFGESELKSAIYGSETAANAARDLDFFFSSKSTLQTSAYFNNCSCLVIKPHLITENYVGQIFDALLTSGFEISAAEMFWLDRPSAEVPPPLRRSSWRSTREWCPSTTRSWRSSRTAPASRWR